jgi:hypothetical protein
MKLKSTARPQTTFDQLFIALMIVAMILAPVVVIVNFLTGARTIHKALTEKPAAPAPPPQIVVVNPPVPAAVPAPAPLPGHQPPPVPPPLAARAAPPLAQCPVCGGPVIYDAPTGKNFCRTEKRFV